MHIGKRLGKIYLYINNDYFWEAESLTCDFSFLLVCQIF